MSVWSLYETQVKANGDTERESVLTNEKRMLKRQLKDSLSYFDVKIDGVDQSVSIVTSNNINQKYIMSLPDETFDCGALVNWMDNYWLITEKDAAVEVYTKAKMIQCNYKLKWVDENNVIREQWCVIEDGTKYLTGENEDRYFFTTRGDSRIAVTMPRNIHTVKLNRENRFLIDDPLSSHKLAYALTKPLKIGHVYGDKGVFGFVMQEIVANDDDNFNLMIADYYKHFPNERPGSGSNTSSNTYIPEAYNKGGWT